MIFVSPLSPSPSSQTLIESPLAVRIASTTASEEEIPVISWSAANSLTLSTARSLARILFALAPSYVAQQTSSISFDETRIWDGVAWIVPDADTGDIAEWTNSAAAVRYWMLRNRRKIPASFIDNDSFAEADTLSRGLVATTVNPSTAGYEGYPTHVPRYSADGIIEADDEPGSLENELDFCWQGQVVNVGGKLYARPGKDRPSRMTIDVEADVLESGRGAVNVFPEIGELMNALSLSLEQSAAHDYTPLLLPSVVDTFLRQRDGVNIAPDLGEMRFVNQPSTANRLMAIMLRRARYTTTLNYRLRPGDNYERFGLIPLDRVTLDDPENGLSGYLAEVVSLTANEDWSVQLVVQHAPDGIYDDTAALPPLKPSEIDIADPSDVARPTGVSTTVGVDVLPSGEIVPWLRFSWDIKTVASTAVRFRLSGATAWEYRTATGDNFLERPIAGGAYEFQIAHVSIRGAASAWTESRTVTVPSGRLPADAQIHFGAGPPEAALGVDGDFYIGSIGPTLWKKTGGTWGELDLGGVGIDDFEYDSLTGVFTATMSDGTTRETSFSDGKDNDQIERIYIRTKTATEPTLPVATAEQRQIDDFVPAGGYTDDEVKTDATWKNSWEIYRTGEPGVWSQWLGPIARTPVVGDFSDTLLWKLSKTYLQGEKVISPMLIRSAGNFVAVMASFAAKLAHRATATNKPPDTTHWNAEGAEINASRGQSWVIFNLRNLLLWETSELTGERFFVDQGELPLSTGVTTAQVQCATHHGGFFWYIMRNLTAGNPRIALYKIADVTDPASAIKVTDLLTVTPGGQVAIGLLPNIGASAETVTLRRPLEEKPVIVGLTNILSILSVSYWTPDAALRAAPDGSIAVNDLGRRAYVKPGSAYYEVWPPAAGWPDVLPNSGGLEIVVRRGMALADIPERWKAAVVLCVRQLYDVGRIEA